MRESEFKKQLGYYLRSRWQLIKWCFGKSEHNCVDNECVPDFSCCLENKTPVHKRIVETVRGIFKWVC